MIFDGRNLYEPAWCARTGSSTTPSGGRRAEADGARDPSDCARARVLVVGDVMLDRYWFGDVSRISPEAPVPVVHVSATEERPGGAANVARNCAALGGAGAAALGRRRRRGGALARAAARTPSACAPRLHRDAAIATTVKLRVIGQQQQLLRIDFERAPSHEVLAAKLDEFERLAGRGRRGVLSDYGKGGPRRTSRR